MPNFTARQIEVAKGILTIVSSMAAPFGAWALDHSTLRAAVVLALISGLTAGRNWLGDSPMLAPALPEVDLSPNPPKLVPPQAPMPPNGSNSASNMPPPMPPDGHS